MWEKLRSIDNGIKAIGNRCDSCALPDKGKGHRCSRCLTKKYCGDQCRMEDWEKVHKLVCREGEVARMKKHGRRRKTKDVKEN